MSGFTQCTACNLVVPSRNLNAHIEESHVGPRGTEDLKINCFDCGYSVAAEKAYLMAQHCLQSRHNMSSVRLGFDKLIQSETERFQKIWELTVKSEAESQGSRIPSPMYLMGSANAQESAKKPSPEPKRFSWEEKFKAMAQKRPMSMQSNPRISLAPALKTPKLVPASSKGTEQSNNDEANDSGLSPLIIEESAEPTTEIPKSSSSENRSRKSAPVKIAQENEKSNDQLINSLLRLLPTQNNEQDANGLKNPFHEPPSHHGSTSPSQGTSDAMSENPGSSGKSQELRDNFWLQQVKLELGAELNAHHHQKAGGSADQQSERETGHTDVSQTSFNNSSLLLWNPSFFGKNLRRGGKRHQSIYPSATCSICFKTLNNANLLIKVKHALCHDKSLWVFKCAHCDRTAVQSSDIIFHHGRRKVRQEGSLCDGQFVNIQTPEIVTKIKAIMGRAFPSEDWEKVLYPGRKIGGITY